MAKPTNSYMEMGILLFKTKIMCHIYKEMRGILKHGGNG